MAADMARDAADGANEIINQVEHREIKLDWHLRSKQNLQL
jgi:hypothetical protein